MVSKVDFRLEQRLLQEILRDLFFKNVMKFLSTFYDVSFMNYLVVIWSDQVSVFQKINLTPVYGM